MYILGMGFAPGTKIDPKELERRRLKAARLFERGLGPSEIARRLKVSCQSACRWWAKLRAGGKSAIGAQPWGRRSLLSDAQLRDLERSLVEGPEKSGYSTPLWTAARVADLIRRKTGVRYHTDHIYRLLARLGWSCQRPSGRALERDEAKVRRWKRREWPALKKEAIAEGRAIVFVDESGLSQRPHQVHTWSPRGQTPVLQHAFNWKSFSVIAGITVSGDN